VDPDLDLQTNCLDCYFCGSRHSTSNQTTTASFLTPPDSLRTLTIMSYHSALSFEIYWYCCWMNQKIKRSSFTTNRPAGSSFQLRHQFENVITSSRFRLDANETMYFQIICQPPRWSQTERFTVKFKTSALLIKVTAWNVQQELTFLAR